MTEESTVYAAPDPRATIADRLFADVTTDAEKALEMMHAEAKNWFTFIAIVRPAVLARNERSDNEEANIILDACQYTIANELMRMKGYDGPQDAWRKLGFVWWVENKLRPAECKTMADVLRQYEEGGEPAYVRD